MGFSTIPRERRISLAFNAMGCRFEVLIDAERSGLDRIEALAIAEDLRELTLDWHRRLSAFEPGSVVSQINLTPGGVTIPLDDDLFALCAQCEQLRIKTGGAFNIAAGTLMGADGPNRPGLDAALDLDPDARTITKSHAAAMLDFGAVAKGFVLDLIRDELADQGVRHAFIHGGTSSVLAVGSENDARAWSLLVEPFEGFCVSSHTVPLVTREADTSATQSAILRHPGTAALRVSRGTIMLSNLSAAISDTMAQAIETDGQRVGHVIDPRPGRHSLCAHRRVACVHRSAAVADAYATACCVEPGLVDLLVDDLCTLIVYEEGQPPIIHDPLGVVCMH